MMEILDSGERRVFDNGFQRDMSEGKECMEIKEEWQKVVGYEGLYEVSNLGRVRSLIRKTRIKDKSNHVMRPKYDTKGYSRVNLHKDGKCQTRLISRMVAEAFIPNPNNLPQVGHEDDNPTNNNVQNLYWTDSRENNSHNGKLIRFQELHNAKIAIIAQKLSKPVVRIAEDGTRKEYVSMQAAQRDGFSTSKITLCCNGKRKHHGGYEWRFINDKR